MIPLEKIKKLFYRIIAVPYIPLELKKAKGPFLLHISDTPAEIYPYIQKVISLIAPKYIIHTGDMVDNIKLQLNKNYLAEYKQNIKKLISTLEMDQEIAVYYVLGNHDDLATVKKIAKRGIILDNECIVIEGTTFYATHCFMKNVPESEYYLFGHNFKSSQFLRKGQLALNGLLFINVIDLSNYKVYQLDYPMGTNHYRKMEKRRIKM